MSEFHEFLDESGVVELKAPPRDGVRDYSMPELARQMKVGRKKIREWVKSGIIVAYDVGHGRLHFTHDSVCDARRRLAPKWATPSQKRRPQDEDIDPRVRRSLDAG
jgi:hypothetical protein